MPATHSLKDKKFSYGLRSLWTLDPVLKAKQIMTQAVEDNSIIPLDNKNREAQIS